VDLFAGTGVLGLEAVSRGAQSVTLVEKTAQAARVIRQNLEGLNTGQASLAVELVQGDALHWIESCAPHCLDIAFVDPPFDSGLEASALAALVECNCMAEGGLVYLETSFQAGGYEPGMAWNTVKDKTLGDVRMRLLEKT
jgi:16S rRNA (guanine966-N2)-methyltransferase